VQVHRTASHERSPALRGDAAKGGAPCGEAQALRARKRNSPRGSPRGVFINRPYFCRLAATTLSRSACAARSISLLSLWLWTPRPAETAW